MLCCERRWLPDRVLAGVEDRGHAGLKLLTSSQKFLHPMPDFSRSLLSWLVDANPLFLMRKLRLEHLPPSGPSSYSG